MPASRTRLFLGALILTILAAAGWWVLSSSGVDSALQETADGATAPASGAQTPGSLDGEPAAAPNLERAEAATAGAKDPADGDFILTVRALHAVTREPVPNAEILYIWREDPNFMAMINAWQRSDRETEYRKHGRSIRADGSGEARISVAGTVAYLAARSGSLYGAGASFANEPGSREIVLLLGEDRNLTVRVVSAAGAPVANVPLCLYTPSDYQARDPRRTDEKGIAVFAHLQTYYQTVGEVPDLELTFAFPALDRPRVPIRWQEPPAEPVTLVMPPTGSLAVEVLDSTGAPWRQKLALNLQQHVDTPSQFEDEETFQPRIVLGNTSAMMDEQGVARFPFVGLGMQLDAAGQFTSAARDWTTVTGPGPLAAGQEARLTLRAGPQPSVVVFRLLLPDGRPTAGEPFQGMLVWLDAKGDPLNLEYEGTNSFDDVHRLPIPLEEPTGWVRREYYTFRQEAVPGELALTAMLDLSAPLLPGENDLGEVRTQEAPLIAGGTVVDDSGEPIHGASLSTLSQNRQELDPQYFLHMTYPAFSDAAGRFRLSGALRSGEYLLVAKLVGYLDGRVPLVPGADSHLIVMTAGCRVQGTVLLDESIPRKEIEVSTLRDGKGPRFIDRPWGNTLQANGSFSIEGLEPGTVTVRLGLVGSQLRIFDVPNVTVAADTAPDPRLNPLDLRGKIRRVTLQVLDQTGGQLSRAEYCVIDPAMVAENWGSTGNGQAVLYLSAPSVNVGVRAPGYVGKIVEGVTEDSEVRLERAPEVEFALEDPAIMQKFPGTVLTVLWHSPLNRRFAQSIPLDAEGKGRLTLPGWGRFAVGIFVPLGDGSERLDVARVNGEEWPIFTFSAAAPIPTCPIPCSLAAVERAIAQAPSSDDE